jgi:uncharacterized membrane protein
MKNSLFGLFLFPALFSFGQQLKWADSLELSEQDDFLYVNANMEQKVTIEESTTLLIDFSLRDATLPIDSASVLYNGKRITSERLMPLLILGADESFDFEIELYKDGKVLSFSNGEERASFEVNRLDKPVFVNDEIVLGVLLVVLAFIFYTSHKKSKFWTKFYTIVPALLLCYLVPAILDMLGLISKEYSELYPMARDYLLPAALILMTIGIDFKGIINLGPKALIMFFTATIGVIIGGPIAILVYSMIDPTVVGGEGYEATWRGMATIAGSWIGGGANQNAMFETYRYAPELYGRMIVVDVVVANIWMAILLFGAARSAAIDRWLKADSSSIENLKERVMEYQQSNARIPTLTDYMVILGLTFSIVAISHFTGNELAVLMSDALGKDSPFASSFFWLVVLATTGGLILSLTKARKYEGAGASKLGSVFIYILVATIGMKMELEEAVKQPQLILVGMIWMSVHVIVLLIVAKLIKAPFFFVAVGSKANIGGAASAPIIASAFHPSLASVGALLAVLGYAIGTYGGIVSAELMRWVAP